MFKKIFTLAVFSLATFFATFTSSFAVHVNGYFRSNGTYVNGYERTAPDGNPYNNYSYPGNYNPNTGTITGGNASTYLNNYYNTSSSSYYPTATSSYYSTIPSYELVYGGYKSYGVLFCDTGYYEKNSACIKAPDHSTAYGYSSFYCDSGYTMDSGGTQCIENKAMVAVKMNNYCSTTYGINSSFNGTDNCVCNSGYIWSKSGSSYSCITPTQSCQVQFGTDAYGDKDYCYCQTGYQMVTANGIKQCTYSVSCPQGTTNSNNQCIPTPQLCQTNYGTNATSTDGTNCVCGNGYTWNIEKTSCIVQPKMKATTKAKPAVAKKTSYKK